MIQSEILPHDTIIVRSVDLIRGAHDVRLIESDSEGPDPAGSKDNLKIQAPIAALLDAVPHASSGLPDDLFYYISRTTPLVNVDLLIRNEKGQTLLSWRNDSYAGTGWHVPGGIVRFKEALETRVRKVAEIEIGADVQFDSIPIAIHQMIHCEREVRGHFISLLYRCSLSGEYKPQNQGLSPESAGYLAWHAECPANLLRIHEIYRKHIDEISR